MNQLRAASVTGGDARGLWTARAAWGAVLAELLEQFENEEEEDGQ